MRCDAPAADAQQSTANQKMPDSHIKEPGLLQTTRTCDAWCLVGGQRGPRPQLCRRRAICVLCCFYGAPLEDIRSTAPCLMPWMLARSTSGGRCPLLGTTAGLRNIAAGLPVSTVV